MIPLRWDNQIPFPLTQRNGANLEFSRGFTLPEFALHSSEPKNFTDSSWHFRDQNTAVFTWNPLEERGIDLEVRKRQHRQHPTARCRVKAAARRGKFRIILDEFRVRRWIESTCISKCQQFDSTTSLRSESANLPQPSVNVLPLRSS